MIRGEFAHKLPGSGQKQTPMMDGEWRWRANWSLYPDMGSGVSVVGYIRSSLNPRLTLK